MWWTYWSSRNTNVPIDIRHEGGTTRVYINQQQNGSRWNVLGTYYFEAGASYDITVTAQPGPSSTCADAVRFIYVPGVDIIDNGDSLRTSSTGVWGISGAAGPYGTDSYWSRDGSTFTWTYTPTDTGNHELSMWWTYWSSRSTNVPIDIEHGGGTTRVYINQQQNGSRWNVLGTYYFEAGVSYNITVTAQPGPSSTCADAVRFIGQSGGGNAPPVAAIDSITPNPALPGETVLFSGSGTDSDGTIAGYRWRSSIDGILSTSASFSTLELSQELSSGVHVIYFQVQDDAGSWSLEANAILGYVGCGSPVRIMPVGDSITWGTYGTIESRSNDSITGYRLPLHHLLVTEGYSFDFVGPLQSGRTITPPFDIDHDGWGTYTAGNIAGNIYNWLSANPADIVLLHIGTNGLDPVNGPNDVRNILIEIDRFSPDVTVLLARIINQTPYSANTTLFNDNVEAMAEARIAGGDRIIIVDQEGALNYGTDMSDRYHPNESGYNKIAGAWLEALTGILPSCGDFSPSIFTYPVLTGMAGEPYAYDVEAIGMPVPTYSLRSAPSGMTIDPVSGLIQWAPGSNGSFPVSVEADNGIGTPAVQSFVIEVSQIFSVTASAPGGNGTIICNPETVAQGGSSECTTIPDSGYLLETLTDNGVVVTGSVSGNRYTITNITEDRLVEATFAMGTVQEFIIDSGDPATSFTGVWAVSGAADPFDPGDPQAVSLWSRDGATYTWTFTPLVSGYYQFSMWWTEWPSRHTNIPVDIDYAGGTTRVFINQQLNGGRWNVIGGYPFEAGVSYDITIISQPGPSSTCADAVRFVYVPGTNIPPVATIDSVSPEPAMPGETVTLTGHGTDTDGTVAGCNWRSSIDGELGNTDTLSTSILSNGTHTIYFKVQDNEGAWSEEVTTTMDVEEHVFAAFGYGTGDTRSVFTSFLRSIRAYESGGVWIYRNEARNKNYVIHMVNSIEGLKGALRTQGSTVLLYGHSNYGLGPVFATSAEQASYVIENILYVDDDRILNFSSPWIHVSISGMRTGQAYPHWWPIFQDGTSAIMPYDWGDPRGDPPFNYYPTYQVPGDPTHYKVETVHNSAVTRFSGYYGPIWYSPDGSPPDPGNPDHLQYFITNPEPWYPSFELTGDWVETQSIAGYFRENYHYSAAGQGNDRAEWIFRIPEAGDYKIYAWWTSSTSRPTNAPYTINHALGSTTVRVNQRVNGGRWNELGEFNFGVGEYSVILTDDADSGNVVADGIRLAHVDNPPEILKADFNASNRSGPAPLEVSFDSENVGDVQDRLWDFGDGFQNGTRDSIDHIYTTPGTYTVRYTVYGPLGSDTTTEYDYITVGAPEPPLKAEFDSAYSQEGLTPLQARFRDRSSGDIVSWQWDFGDGGTSAERSPYHTYLLPGIYTVSLTITDSNGNTDTEIKEEFQRVSVFDKNVDNVDYPKTHFSSKTILFRRDIEIPKEEFRYDRMFYVSCNSGNYYIDTFNRGIMFYTLNAHDVTGGQGFSTYLRGYFEGKTDEEIWMDLQDLEPVFDFYDFNKLPSEQ
jgi:PKD repeat protein